MKTLYVEEKPLFRVGFDQDRVSDDSLSACLPFYTYRAECLICRLTMEKSLSMEALHYSHIDLAMMTINEAEAAFSNRGCDHASFLRPQIEAIVKNPFRT